MEKKKLWENGIDFLLLVSLNNDSQFKTEHWLHQRDHNLILLYSQTVTVVFIVPLIHTSWRNSIYVPDVVQIAISCAMIFVWKKKRKKKENNNSNEK